MLSVWKYPCRWDDSFQLEMPVTAKILTVQMQNGDSYLWALVDPGESSRVRTFRLTGTGHPIKQSANQLNYIGTFQAEGLVFHLFEVIDEEELVISPPHDIYGRT